jgi:PHD/YefM family antitoxin component YafN of YafNO toxin-antitoxin module
MTISATDFQLRVNEYFNKLIQGEDVIIERYNNKFAVLVSYEKYLEKFKEESEKVGQREKESQKGSQKASQKEQENQAEHESVIEQKDSTDENPMQLTQEELMKLLKLLLKE